MNVSVLSMGLAEFLGNGVRDVRAIGVAGLLRDMRPSASSSTPSICPEP